jgi:hypothetical protein
METELLESNFKNAMTEYFNPSMPIDADHDDSVPIDADDSAIDYGIYADDSIINQSFNDFMKSTEDVETFYKRITNTNGGMPELGSYDTDKENNEG